MNQPNNELPARAKGIFARIQKDRGDVAAIHSAYCEFPEGVEAHYDFYRSVILDDALPLKRAERETLAVATSKANSCKYCISHHEEALRGHAHEVSKERQTFFETLASTLSEEPWKATELWSEARKIGLSKREYSHAAVVVAYFNMANRMAFAFNLELEKDFERTCGP